MTNMPFGPHVGHPDPQKDNKLMSFFMILLLRKYNIFERFWGPPKNTKMKHGRFNLYVEQKSEIVVSKGGGATKTIISILKEISLRFYQKGRPGTPMEEHLPAKPAKSCPPIYVYIYIYIYIYIFISYNIILYNML